MEVSKLNMYVVCRNACSIVLFVMYISMAGYQHFAIYVTIFHYFSVSLKLHFLG